MHKKWLGFSSVMMAGMLAVSSVSPAAFEARAAELGEEKAVITEEASLDETKDSEETKAQKDTEEKASDEEAKEAAEGSSAETSEKEEKASTDVEESKEDDSKADEKESSDEKSEDKVKDDTEEKKDSKEEADEEESKDKDSKEKETKEDKEKSDNEDKSEEKDKKDDKKETDKEKKDDAEDAEKKDNSLIFFDRWNQSSTFSGVLSFEKQYQEYVYDLGETYDASIVKSIKVKVSDQGDNVCIKLYDDSLTEKQANYGCNGSSEYVMIPNYDGKVRYIAVMSMADGEDKYPYGITVDEVSVDAEASTEQQNEETVVFKGDDLKFSGRWDKKEVEGNTLTYEEAWSEYWFSFGREFAADSIKSIKVKVKDQDLSVAFKIYDADGGEIQAFYGQNGKNEYVLYPSQDKGATHFAVMAMNDQTYPGSITIESVEVKVDTTPESEKPEKGVEYDIVDLRDPMTEILGDDFIVGTAISYQEFADSAEMELVTKHFNGVTLGNELKPDSMLKKDAEIKTVELNGEEFAFPELNFSNPERYLDFFVDWNNEHPDKKIRIRGHVLVWHSQTPEFFFHEDYDTSKPYVTPEVMNKRLEYYIKSVAEHFTAEGSKYRDLFYGWDVVNEAVSDSTGTYRNASENSSWWAVYNSCEFIQNAFVYANRYMPSNIALFYNDYNETGTNKMGGICELLKTVKNTEGARIDGMGMQAHYQIESNSPSMDQFKVAAKTYGEIVDQVQITELDFKGSANSTDERLAERYKAVYDTIRRLKAEGTNITGMTIWGVVDKHSWLQTANNNGGGSNGSSRQYPLLFDDNYKAKNSFWALANAGELEPEIKNIILIQNINGDFTTGNEYSFGEGESKLSFVPMWDENGVAVKVTVLDGNAEDNDSFTVYADDGNSIKAVTVTRSEATAVEGGYESVVRLDVDKDVLASNKLKLDVTFKDGEKTFAFGDTTFKQADSSKYFAETVVKPLLSVNKGTVVVDGDPSDEDWAKAKELQLTINTGANVTANAKTLWDEENLYVLVDVKDPVLNKDSSQNHEQDSLEVFIDENNHKTTSYEEDDKQYRINYENTQSFNGKKCLEENMKSAAVVTEDGYRIEAAFKWTDITPQAGNKVGLELQINDADDSGKRIGTLSWADKTGNGWSSPEVFGTILLTVENADTPDTPVDPDPADEPVDPNPSDDPVDPNPTDDPVDPNPSDDPEDPNPSDDPEDPNPSDDPVDPNPSDDPVDPDPTDDPVDPAPIVEPEKEEARLVSFLGFTFYVTADGTRLTGFHTIDGNDYYFGSTGIMYRLSWINENGNWYYAKLDGTLAKNEIVSRLLSRYIFNEEGVMQTGFVHFNGNDYYCGTSGAIYTNSFITVDCKTYYAKNDGRLAKNETIWRLFRRYRFDENGVLVK
ncbi:endo-1,4-beta-xylanase [Butyrivibrio sp. YAB3001]|uniref:endo-1,4-beta-xylanase n=1 Tax=Butyrivibrio sp. YAB3001 TaxID=1520812 RepID=UPI0008F65884|nr:endo-1,4-beta-xylanase [Butyrivibrio sp. YAB3001]SFC40933.1 endo-1,4-beta-xylanase [Butyrivibrio sp. YAB3001]